MATTVSQAPMSRSSPSPPKRRHSPNLSLDFADLPPLTTPSPPSNTLLITNLEDASIFTAPNLQAIRDAINAQAPLHSFAPLKSFRRIVASFYSIEDATAVRKVLDGENVLGSRVRVYFGEPTKLEVEDQHLHAPDSGRLFFISPPPSPPHGWMMRNEEPPNKEVHAEDLTAALSKLLATPHGADYQVMPLSPVEAKSPGQKRSRSSTLVYHPADQGHHPDLPAITLEDTSEDHEAVIAEESDKILAHTARPPVELME